MHPGARPLAAAILLGLCFLAGGCRDKSAAPGVIELHGEFDIIEACKQNARWKNWKLHAYQLDRVWGGAGSRPDGPGSPRRAKLSLWAEGTDTPVAELFFHDPDQFDPQKLDRNVDPNKSDDAAFPKPGQPFQLHFPSAALGPISASLRSANAPVYLFFYRDQWAIGVQGPEFVGVE